MTKWTNKVKGFSHPSTHKMPGVISFLHEADSFFRYDWARSKNDIRASRYAIFRQLRRFSSKRFVSVKPLADTTYAATARLVWLLSPRFGSFTTFVSIVVYLDAAVFVVSLNTIGRCNEVDTGITLFAICRSVVQNPDEVSIVESIAEWRYHASQERAFALEILRSTRHSWGLVQQIDSTQRSFIDLFYGYQLFRND